MAGRDTPATRAARAGGVEFSLHEYRHDPAAEAYALEAATALGLDPRRVFKTLVVDRDGTPTVCIVPAGDQLDLRSLGKRAVMAQPDHVARYARGSAQATPDAGRRTRSRAAAPILQGAAPGAYEPAASARSARIELSPIDLVAPAGAEVCPLRR
jgi:Cys-tRNA(Pro)/Cys-tRNA(Cys) deacylase